MTIFNQWKSFQLNDLILGFTSYRAPGTKSINQNNFNQSKIFTKRKYGEVVPLRVFGTVECVRLGTTIIEYTEVVSETVSVSLLHILVAEKRKNDEKSNKKERESQERSSSLQQRHNSSFVYWKRSTTKVHFFRNKCNDSNVQRHLLWQLLFSFCTWFLYYCTKCRIFISPFILPQRAQKKKKDNLRFISMLWPKRAAFTPACSEVGKRPKREFLFSSDSWCQVQLARRLAAF